MSADGQTRMLADPSCMDAACRWVDIDNNPRSVAVTSTADSMFKLHDNGSIFLWLGTTCAYGRCPNWTLIDNNPETIAIAASSSELFQLHRGGAIWRWRGSTCDGGRCPSWERLGNNPRTKAISAAGTRLFQLHDTGEVWRWMGAPCSGDRCVSWQKLDNNPRTKQISAAAPSNLYQRHGSGEIWRWDGRPCSGDQCPHWSRIDNNPGTTTIVAALGDLYQLHDNGSVWRWQGRVCEGASCPHWERLDANGRTRAIAAGEKPFVSDLSTATPGPAPVYQVHEDGAVWRWLGLPCEEGRCLSWRRVSDGNAFTRYRADRGGLYVFDGEPRFASAPPASGARVEAFGYDTMRFARIGDRTVRMNVLLMLTTYADTSFDADQTEAFYREKYFGARQSIRGWFRKNAPHLDLDIGLAGIVRVRDPRPLACAHRWSGIRVGSFSQSTCPTGRPDSQAFTMATVEQLEMLTTEQAASLARFDRNSDGVLSTDEVYVINLQAYPPTSEGYPYGDNGGLRRDLPRCAALRGTGKTLCGAFLPIGDETNFATVVHEMSHLFGAADLYGASGGNSYQYTIMGATITNNEMFFHLDPWHKMRMGFVRPRVLPIPDDRTSRQAMRLTLPVNSHAYQPVLFYDPARGTSELFMMEFRKTRGGGFDDDVPSSGLVIWHVKTDNRFNPVNLQTINPSFPEGGAVAVIGAPGQSIARGRAWTDGDNDISLRWPDGGDSGLRLRVDPFDPTASFLTVNWWTE